MLAATPPRGYKRCHTPTRSPELPGTGSATNGLLAGQAPARGVCVRGFEPALLAILVGEGGAAGQGADGPGEVLYLGGDHEELASRSLGHLGERPQVEVAEGFGGEVGALEPLEELAGHLDLGGLDVAVGLGLALGA